MDHRSLRREAEHNYGERIRRHAGGAADEREDKAMVDRAVKRGVGQHEEHDHKGEAKTKLKLKDGGGIDGHGERRRLDRPGRKRREDGGVAPDAATSAMTRAVDAGLAKNINPAPQSRARGGRAHKGPAHVNVIVASGAPQDRPVPVPIPAAGGPPRPPMPPPGAGMGPGGPGMPPPGGMPMVPGAGGPPGLAARPPMMPPGGMPMRARGGRAGLGIESMRAGAETGEGRLEKRKLAVEDANAAD